MLEPDTKSFPPELRDFAGNLDKQLRENFPDWTRSVPVTNRELRSIRETHRIELSLPEKKSAFPDTSLEPIASFDVSVSHVPCSWINRTAWLREQRDCCRDDYQQDSGIELLGELNEPICAAVNRVINSHLYNFRSC